MPGARDVAVRASEILELGSARHREGPGLASQRRLLSVGEAGARVGLGASVPRRQWSHWSGRKTAPRRERPIAGESGLAVSRRLR